MHQLCVTRTHVHSQLVMTAKLPKPYAYGCVCMWGHISELVKPFAHRSLSLFLKNFKELDRILIFGKKDPFLLVLK